MSQDGGTGSYLRPFEIDIIEALQSKRRERESRGKTSNKSRLF